MKNEIAAKKKKKNGNWLKVAPSLKKEKKELKKKRQTLGKTRDIQSNSQERMWNRHLWLKRSNQYSAPPSHYSSNSFTKKVFINVLAK